MQPNSIVVKMILAEHPKELFSLSRFDPKRSIWGFDLCISATNAQAWQYKTGGTNPGVTEGKVKRTMSVDLKTKFALLGYLIYHSYSRAVGDTFTDSKERRMYQKPIIDWLAILPSGRGWRSRFLKDLPFTLAMR